jgi:HPt (histidine-containing phosphotransfer) domain-containing protein
MKRRMAQVNESIERYLRSMDSADRAEPEIAELKTYIPHIADMIWGEFPPCAISR